MNKVVFLLKDYFIHYLIRLNTLRNPMVLYFRYIFSIILMFTMLSCNKSIKYNDENLINTNEQREYIEKVKIVSPILGDFKNELFINGKVFAKKKVDLKFLSEEKVISIYVKNGHRVRKGDIIAKQFQNTYRNNVSKAREQLERSKIDVEDILLGFGYSLKDSANIPSNTLKMATNRANYNSSFTELNNAKIVLNSATLKAPFNGVVANLILKKYSYPDISKSFCTIIDNNVLDVEFKILETEYGFIEKGQEIMVSISADSDSFDGKIEEINPIVDEDGMILIKGQLKNKDDILLDGMNVNILVTKNIKNTLSIPKESIVLRDGKKVVFTYKDGRALWNYVETSYENSKFIVITKGIHKEDNVIYSNNINLAHNTNVVIEK